MLFPIVLASVWLQTALGWSCLPNSSELSSVEQNCRTQLWDVGPLDYSNNYTIGAPQLQVVSRVEVYNGIDYNRTYSHHPLVSCASNSAPSPGKGCDSEKFGGERAYG